MHPAEYAALRHEFANAPIDQARVITQASDGYTALRALLPPCERRGLVLVDPPYEAQDEYTRVTTALKQGFSRFPSGVYALWYPLTQRARIEEFLAGVLALQPPPTLLAELSVAPDTSDRKLKGCGLVIINPPWRFEAQAREILGFLAPVLAQEPGADVRVSWLVSEP
jgi:23S rRNA (adenine2030-N6)-methyltransferase